MGVVAALILKGINNRTRDGHNGSAVVAALILKGINNE